MKNTETPSQPEAPRTEAQQKAEERFVQMGYPPQDKHCTHEHYRFDKHGRRCTCGTWMVASGD